jgi:hypothetical protein
LTKALNFLGDPGISNHSKYAALVEISHLSLKRRKALVSHHPARHSDSFKYCITILVSIFPPSSCKTSKTTNIRYSSSTVTSLSSRGSVRVVLKFVEVELSAINSQRDDM